jgi:hypothetical protein
MKDFILTIEVIEKNNKQRKTISYLIFYNASLNGRYNDCHSVLYESKRDITVCFSSDFITRSYNKILIKMSDSIITCIYHSHSFL